MKRVLCMLFACLLCCSGFSALAVEEDVEAGAVDQGGTPSATVAPVTLPQPLQVEVTLIDGNAALGDSPAPEAPSFSMDDDTTQAMLDRLAQLEANTEGNALGVSSGVASVSALDPEQPDREGLAGVVSSIFGEYTPRTYTTSTYIDGEVVMGMEIVPGLAGLDWPWLVGAALFAIILFCLFKLLGGIWS